MRLLELFTRVICHDSALNSKISEINNLTKALFNMPCIGLEVLSYWKEQCFSVIETSIFCESFDLSDISNYVVSIAGRSDAVQPQFFSNEVIVACYSSVEEIKKCKSLAFVHCTLLGLREG